MRNEMIKGYVDAIVLSLLSRGDAYGYEISKQVTEQTSGRFELKEGTLYPALKRMESQGFIEGYWDDRQAGPRRKYYRITQSGTKKLEENKEAWEQNVRVIDAFLGGNSDGARTAVLKPDFT